MNETVNVNKEHKNSVFSLLFSNPDVLRELYSAIANVELPPDISIDINTLSNVLIREQINDISFTIGDRLVVLLEHQSTINNNMPLRLHMYIASVYEKIIDYRKIYWTKLVFTQKYQMLNLSCGVRRHGNSWLRPDKGR